MYIQTSILLRLTRGQAGELICDVEDCMGPVDEGLLADAEAAARMVEGMHSEAEEKLRLAI